MEKDQRGEARIQGANLDLGALEGLLGISQPRTYVVTSLENRIDSTDGELTFIEAFEAANSNRAVGNAPHGSIEKQDVIRFAEGLSGSVDLDGDALPVFGNLKIVGPGAEYLTFDGLRQSGVFEIFPMASCVLSGITITGGLREEGGGILAHPLTTSTLNGVTVIENDAISSGGGICNHGEMLLVNSKVLGNSSFNGGGIHSLSYQTEAQIAIINSFVCGNEASSGAGILIEGPYYRGQMIIKSSTVAGNAGLGAVNVGTLLTAIMDNTIIAGNTSSFGSPDFAGSNASVWAQNCLIGDGSYQEVIVHGEDGNLVGTAEAPIDPRFIRPPSDGGDGWEDDPATQYRDESLNNDYGDLRLRADSPAIDAGSNSTLPADETDLDGDGNTSEPIPLDLVGAARVENGTVDIGAYEFFAMPQIPGDLNADGVGEHDRS